MKKKLQICINVILILIFLKLMFNMIMNNMIIKKYDNGVYSEGEAKLLTHSNFIQPYIANYNYANILYKNNQYEKAIKEYDKALSFLVPKDKECKIRINYALSICKGIELDENNQQSIINAIKKYEEAINILTENGCANKKDNNGHSKEAEQLKQDIQKEIDRLKKLLNIDEDYEQEEKNEQHDNDKKDKIEEKIQELRENATKEQRNIENMYKNYNSGFETYDGKKW